MTERANIVVVGIDESAGSAAAAQWAAAWAQRRSATVQLVHAVSAKVDAGFGLAESATWAEAAPTEAEQLVEQVAEPLRAAYPDVTVESVVRPGPPGQVFLDLSAEVALTVFGASGRGRWRELLLGSLPTHTAEQGHGPVVVLREEAAGVGADGPILLGVDPAHPSAPALDFAFDSAARSDLPLVAVTAWNDAHVRNFLQAVPLEPDAEAVESNLREELVQALAPWAERYPDVLVRPLVVAGPADACLLGVAERVGPSLVVVGSRGLGALTGWLMDSVSRSVLQQAVHPVVVVQNRNQPVD